MVWSQVVTKPGQWVTGDRWGGGRSRGLPGRRRGVGGDIEIFEGAEVDEDVFYVDGIVFGL